ncbi:MAG: hypothetical protein ACFFC7_29075 [Candidatus Hermodarchaeota archaeon]
MASSARFTWQDSAAQRAKRAARYAAQKARRAGHSGIDLLPVAADVPRTRR